MSETFENKVIAVTGAGKGLGRAYAHYFARLGATVVVNNRRHAGEEQSSADRVVAEIAEAGGTAAAEYSSVEDETAGNALLACALDNFGRLDCLIANAGVMENRTFRKQTLESLRDLLDINLMGTINVVHPVFLHMCERQSGTIVVSTSSAGLFGEFGLPGYSASKAAVIGLMRSLSLEGAPKNVQVNAIAPYAATRMTAEHLSDEVIASLGAEHVAPVVAWLATGAVSGETLLAGGGRIARARMKITEPVAMPAIDSDDWQALSTLPVERDFHSAIENFQAFVAGLGVNKSG